MRRRERGIARQRAKKGVIICNRGEVVSVRDRWKTAQTDVVDRVHVQQRAAILQWPPNLILRGHPSLTP